MILIALICSLSALISGVVAIGTGRDFHFETSEIWEGRENAIAYIWLTCSTIFTIFHSGMIAFWIYLRGPFFAEGYTNNWMALHAGMGLLFCAAHIFLKHKLVAARHKPVCYLWGNT